MFDIALPIRHRDGESRTRNLLLLVFSEKQIPRCAPFLRQGKRDDAHFNFLRRLRRRSLAGAWLSASVFPRAERIRVAPEAWIRARLAALTHAQELASIRVQQAALTRAWPLV